VGKEPTESKSVVAVRIRGTISARREARQTLRLLHLTRNNYAVLVNDRSSFVGMLNAVQGYVAWGEASKDVVSMLIGRRGRLLGDKVFTEEYLQKIGFKTIEELADAVYKCRIQYWTLPTIKPVFRLSPPTGGFRGSIKDGYGAGGELGYQGAKINDLVKRMI
jgi:large subunit ribosomal protein L30